MPQNFQCAHWDALGQSQENRPWLAYAKGLHNGKSIRACAKDCGIAVPMSFRWRYRFLKADTTDKSLKLHGITEADKTYILESRKGSCELSRPAWKRGGKATKRGISSEQIPILVARDRFGRTTDGVLPDLSAKSINCSSVVWSRRKTLCALMVATPCGDS